MLSRFDNDPKDFGLLYVGCRRCSFHVGHWTLWDAAACLGWVGEEAIAAFQVDALLPAPPAHSTPHPLVAGFGRHKFSEAKFKFQQLTLVDIKVHENSDLSEFTLVPKGTVSWRSHAIAESALCVFLHIVIDTHTLTATTSPS
jgi:hypothetical protein